MLKNGGISEIYNYSPTTVSICNFQLGLCFSNFDKVPGKGLVEIFQEERDI